VRFDYLLKQHQNQNDLIAIITATNRFVTQPIAQALGVEHLLAAEPTEVINLHIEDSGVRREYGIHMTEKIKIAGLKYIGEWLMEEMSNGTLVVENLPCPGLCEELIKYNRLKDKNGSANYDRIMALMLLLFQRQQDEEGTIYGDNTVKSKRDQLFEFLANQYN